MVAASFRLPGELAGAVLRRLRIGTDVGLDDLVEAVSVGVLAGSIAKGAAMEAGEVPPGAEPASVAERWLADPAVSWSCWPTCTLLAALADACGFRAEVVAGRRVDGAAAPVDFHSFVVLDDDRGRWICDPYFGVGPIPADRGGRVVRPGVGGVCTPEGPGWSVAVSTAQWPVTCAYRTITLPLGPADVEAFCRVSTTHTGVGPSRYALRLLADGVAMAREGSEGEASLRRWRLRTGQVDGVDPEVRGFPDLDEAIAALLGLS